VAPKFKPWPEVWQEILDLRWLDTSDCDLDSNEEGWLSVHCPLHSDSSPSLRINVTDGGIRCMAGCEVGSNLNELLELALDSAARRHGTKPKDVVGDLAESRLLPRDWLIDEFDVGKSPGGYSIAGCDPWVDPAIEDETSLFHTDHRIFKRGRWLQPDQTNRPKYAWQPTFKGEKFAAKDLVYNLWRVNSPTVYVCAGPPDAWVMHFNGFPAISFVAGEGSLPSTRAVSRLLDKGVKDAIIIYDVDAAGREGSSKLANFLSREGIGATILDLPDELAKSKKGFDLSDLWVHVRGDKDAFESILSTCESRSYTVNVRVESERERPAAPEVSALSEDGWVDPFLTYAEALKHTTSAPAEFHYFSLMNVIGAVLGRRIAAFYGRQIFPNQYTCLIGPTGRAKKSTAMSWAVEGVAHYIDGSLRISSAGGSAEGLLQDLAFADADPEELDVIRAAMGQTSRKRDKNNEIIGEERLYDKLHRRALILQDEFTTLLAKAKGGGPGGSTMIPTLLNVFNTPEQLRLPTRNKPLVIVHPYVSILSGSTPEFLGRHFSEEDWHSGFGNRLLFVEGPLREAIALPQVPDQDAIDKLIDFLQRVFKRFEGAERSLKPINFTFTKDAEQRWVELFNEWEAKSATFSVSQLAATERTTEYACKFALILAACAVTSANQEETTIDVEDVEIGFCLARFTANVSLRLVDSLLASHDAQMEGEILAFIREHGSASRRNLQKRFSRWGSTTFNRLMDSLERAEVIRKNTAEDFVEELRTRG